MKILGRPIAPGKVEGRALVSPTPFSFVGGVDPRTGRILDPAWKGDGRLAGRIFAFSHGKGSTVGSYVIYGLVKRKVGPAAIVNFSADGIIAVGATLAEIPLVDRVDPACLKTGDRIGVDGDRGTVELPDVKAIPVVTSVLWNRGRILIVRRSDTVGSFRGRWSAISGFVEGREEFKARAVQEIREETGMRGVRFRTAGPPMFARDRGTIYVVHPFRFDAPTREVRLDWENVESRWIRPEEINRFKTVPRLKDVVASVVP